jgi:hypothetical protein
MCGFQLFQISAKFGSSQFFQVLRKDFAAPKTFFIA